MRFIQQRWGINSNHSLLFQKKTQLLCWFFDIILEKLVTRLKKMRPPMVEIHWKHSGKERNWTKAWNLIEWRRRSPFSFGFLDKGIVMQVGLAGASLQVDLLESQHFCIRCTSKRKRIQQAFQYENVLIFCFSRVRVGHLADSCSFSLLMAGQWILDFFEQDSL